MTQWLRDCERRLNDTFPGIPPSLFIASGMAVVSVLAIILPALYMLEGADRQYLRSLFGITWTKFLAAEGTTALGLVSSPVASIVSAVVTVAIELALQGFRRATAAWKANLIKVFYVIAVVNAVVYGSVFTRLFLHTIHSETSELQSKLAGDNSTIKDLNRTLYLKRHNATFSDPAFQNAMGVLQAFTVWRKALGADAKCHILITQPSGDHRDTLTAFYGVLMTAGVMGANCPNGDLQNIGLNPLQAEQEEQKGVIPGVAVIHIPLDAPGSEALFVSLSNLFQSKRSYMLPGSTSEQVVWIQLPADIVWNSDLFERPAH